MKVIPSHIPVLKGEVVKLLKLKPGSVVIDATLGLGGHSLAIAKKIGYKGIIIGIDKDAKSLTIIRKNLSRRQSNSQFIIVCSSYIHLDTIAKDHGYDCVDAILFDLGLSSLQLEGDRGFSFKENAPLDMRFDQTCGPTAADIVNGYSQVQLADLIWQFGQERAARRIAKAIYQHRKHKKIETTDELVQIITQAKSGRRGKIHPATLTFQALRIAVNQELATLETVLPKAVDLLCPNGRLAVISYHSLEDRIVKHFFRNLKQAEKVELITKKPVRPQDEEIHNNPRARSAKLRVIEKI